jgi:hypothetical protein
MLDFDLSILYGVETKRLNEQVKRNIIRFLEDFMFRLTVEEWQTMRSQIATSSETESNQSQNATSSQKHRGKATPYAFTEHGVRMLASVLKSETAAKMCIAVVRAFVALKRFAIQYNDILEQMQELRQRIGVHDAQLDGIYEAIENLLDEKVEQKTTKEEWESRERVGFKK